MITDAQVARLDAALEEAGAPNDWSGIRADDLSLIYHSLSDAQPYTDGRAEARFDAATWRRWEGLLDEIGVAIDARSEVFCANCGSVGNREELFDGFNHYAVCGSCGLPGVRFRLGRARVVHTPVHTHRSETAD